MTTEMVELEKPIRIRFMRKDSGHEGEIVEDSIRAFFMKEICLEPYAGNVMEPSAVLTYFSNIPLTDIVEFVHG